MYGSPEIEKRGPAVSVGSVFSRDMVALVRGSDWLKTCVLPRSVQGVAEGAMVNTQSLKSFFVRKDTALQKLNRFVFWFADNLERVYLPEGLKTIGEMCFADNALERVVIPRSVTSIGKYAFRNCTYLRTVAFRDDSELVEIQ